MRKINRSWLTANNSADSKIDIAIVWRCIYIYVVMVMACSAWVAVGHEGRALSRGE